MAKKAAKAENQADLFPPETFKNPVDWDALAFALRGSVIAVDIETDTEYKGIGPKRDYGLSYIADVTYISLAWVDIKGAHQTAVFSAPFDTLELDFLRQMFARDGLMIVAHNAVFDIRGLSKLVNADWGRLTVWDTMVQARIIHPTRLLSKTDYRGGFKPSVTLLDTAKALGVPYPEYMTAEKKKRGKLHKVAQAEVIQYAADDALLTLKIYEAQVQLIDSDTLYTLAQWGIRAMREYCRMTAEGITLDVPYVQERVAELSRTLEGLAAKLRDLGLDRPTSGPTCVSWIYGKMGVPKPEYRYLSPAFTEQGMNRLTALHIRRMDKIRNRYGIIYDAHNSADQVEIAALWDTIVTDKPQVALSDIQLTDLSSGNPALEPLLAAYPDLKLLYDYNDVDTRLSTLSALLDHAALDGKIHSLLTIGTDTLRRSCQHPQVQNWAMAVENNVAGDMCGIAIGRPGFKLASIDYSNAEMWMAYLISRDIRLGNALYEGGDFHSVMASRYFPTRWTELHDQLARTVEGSSEYNQLKTSIKLLRKTGKTLTFGDNYGMGSRKMAAKLTNDTGIPHTVAQAKELKDSKVKAFPDMARVRSLAEQKAKDQGAVNLWTGQAVWVDPQATFTAWNKLCQGGVGQMVLRAIVEISEYYRDHGMKSRVCLDMHDEIVIEVALDEWDLALQVASEAMETVIPDELNNRVDPPVRWIADFDNADNDRKWGKRQSGPVSGVSETVETTYEPLKSPDPKVAAAARTLGNARPHRLGGPEVLPEPRPKLADVSSRWDELAERVQAYQDKLNGPYKTRLPVIAANGSASLSETYEVDQENWAKIPDAWIEAANQYGFNPEDLIGLDLEALAMMSKVRRAEYLRNQDTFTQLSAALDDLTNQLGKAA